MSSIIKAVCPDFPDDRTVKDTMNRERWYKSVGNVLYVPPEKYLRSYPREVDRYCESIMAFAHIDLSIVESGKDFWNIPHKLYRTEADAIAYLNRLGSYRGVVACDIECSHTGWDNQNMLLLGIKTAGTREVGIIGIFTPPVCAALNKLFKTPVSQMRFLWHNGKFDIGRLRWVCGVHARVDEDTMLLHYVGINEKKGTHGLKVLAPLYLQAPQWDDELDEYKKKRARALKIKIADFRYDDIPLEIMLPYLAMDCTATYMLLDLFMQITRPGAMRAYRNLIRASNIYTYLESNGFMVDQEHLNTIHIELQEACDEADDIVEAAANKYWNAVQYVRDTGAKSMPNRFNLKSPAQLKWLLSRVTGEDVACTDADALESLGKSYKEQDFIRALMQSRKLHKQLDTYVFGIRDATCSDGCVHATFNLHGTETGRLSCSEPNMQNIPRDKKIKNIFKAAPGKILVQLDYSQAELRALAYLSQDPWLINVFVEGRDLHDAVATDMFGPNFTKEQRVQAKTINFGIAYGRGAASLMDEFGCSIGEANGIIAKWYAPMPQVKKWIQDTRLKPQRGQECISAFGRMRHFVITASNINNIQNESINFPVSSIATDLTLISLMDIHDEIMRGPYPNDIKIINNVHDSIIFECTDRPDIVNWIVEIGTRIMKEQPEKQLENCNVPFKADAEVGYSWGKLESWEAWKRAKEETV